MENNHNKIIISQIKSELISLYTKGGFKHYDAINQLIIDSILQSINNKNDYSFVVECSGTKGGNKKANKIIKSLIKCIFEALYTLLYKKEKSFHFMEQDEIDNIKMKFEPVQIEIVNKKTGETYSEELWK